MNKSVTRLATAIKHQLMSEKSYNAYSQKKLVVKVAKDTNKVELVQAVGLIYSAQVVKVNILNVKGKTKNRGNRKGRRSDYKKAYITLAETLSPEIASDLEATIAE